MKLVRHFTPPAAIFGALLAACSPVADEAAGEDAARDDLLDRIEAEGSPENQQEDCLLLVWSEEEEPDIEFDRANDSVKGGAISCATGASPSSFEAAIAALREAARSGDKARLLDHLGVPLLYIDEDGKRQDLTEEQVEALFDDIFDPAMLDMLGNLDLSQMTVEKDQGAFFALGSLWLVVDEQGQPRVVTVNRQALLESAKAARDQSERGQGREISGGN